MSEVTAVIAPDEYETRYSDRRTIGIRVEQGRIIVFAPRGVRAEMIREALASHARWIRARQREHAVREASDRLTQAQLDALKQQARAYIPQRVALFAPMVGVSYSRVSIKAMRSRWGSCSAKGNLNFNCLLMKCPPEVIDSVVVHELCHRLEMNHSRRFYEAVYCVMPDYDRRHGWLKQNGAALIAQLPEKKQ